jgi:hypothetical protein
MLQDLDVKRWYDNVARGSPITAEVRLRRLSLFCEQNGMTAKQLASLGKTSRKTLEDLLQDHVTKMEMEGKAPGYTSGVIKAVKSWLDHNEVEMKRKIKVSNSTATPTIEDERVPEKDELKTLFMYGTERSRVGMTLISQAGLRLETIGNESGTDGLRISDLPEIEILDGRAEFKRIPTIVVVRPPLSKAKHKYFTFLTNEGCEYLKAYLERRMAEGESLSSDSPVIAVTPGFEKMGKGKRNRGSRFICTRNVSREIREAMRPRFKWRPYVLRAYFDTQMLLAESHGKIPHPYGVFFMGHKGDIESRYTTNKGRLPENLIEDMRRAFKESSEYLETTPRPERDKKEILLEMWREQAKMYGIDPMKVRVEREKEVGKELTLEEEEELLKVEIKKVTMPQLSNNGKPYTSKMIGEEELVQHVEEGWEIVRELSKGRFLVKRPNHMEG